MASLVPSTSMKNNYRVNWNHQQNHVLEGLKSVWKRNDQLLTDVTLACDGQYVQVHKLVLSLCSPFFKDLFINNKADKSNTIIILGNVSAINLRYLLQFIYQGKTDIPSQDVDSFLQAGKLLQIEGLSEASQNASTASHPPRTRPETTSNPKPRRRAPSTSSQRSPAASRTDDIISAPPKIARLSEPVIPDVTPMEVIKETIEDPLEGWESYGSGAGEDEEDDGIDLNTVKIEPIRVFPGFVDNHQTEGFYDETIGNDSFPNSEDAESYPIPVSVSSSPVIASSSSRLQPPLSGEPNSTSNNQQSGGKRSSNKFQFKSHLIWKYFESLGTLPHQSGRCQLCSKVIRMSGKSTYGLRQHLQYMHKQQLQEIINQDN